MDSQLLLATVIHSMREGVVIHDHTGVIIEANPAAERILGLSKDQIMGRNSTDPRWRTIREDKSPFPPEEHPSALALSTHKSQRGTLIGIILPSGEERWLTVNAEPIFERNTSRPSHAVVTIEDITRERRRLIKYRESENRLQLSLELGQAATWEIDLKRNRFYHSGSLLKFFGEDVEQKAMHDVWSFVYEDDRDRIKSQWYQHLSGGPPVNTDHRVVFANGKIRWMHAYTQVSEWEHNRPKRIMGFLQDISSRIEQEKHLERALNVAKRASETKSNFVANMSHEIRTPLNGVIGMAQILASTELAQEQKEYLKTILDSGETLCALLDDVLDISKIESGRMKLNPTDSDIFSSLSSACNLFSAIALEKQLEFHVDLSEELKNTYRYDSVRMRQCLFNLLSNAVKFTNKGSISVKACVKNQDTDNHLIEISVADTGRGISSKEQTALFEEFVQLDTGTTRKHGGTGLGLSITRKLAQLMGGDVLIESKMGEGAKFTLTFYAAALAATTEDETYEEEETNFESSLANYRCLIVDDHETNRKILNLMLSNLGMVPSEAQNGQEALEKLSASGFDIVLLDIHMPVMDGKQTLKHIRNSGANWSDIPVVVLTADALDRVDPEWKKLNLNEYVTKPFNSADLFLKLKSSLER